MSGFETRLHINGAFIRGEDAATVARIADALEYGVTWINPHGSMATEMPHGGMKTSGYGSDLSMQSLLKYTQVRHLMTAA